MAYRAKMGDAVSLYTAEASDMTGPCVPSPRVYLCFPLLVAIREFSGGLNASA